MNNEVSFETYQWASGHYLTRQLPDNWNDMDVKSQDDFLNGYVCDTYEYWDTSDLLSDIYHLANDAHKFFKGE